MDFFQLECFVSIAKSKSFTEAAFEMSISQSSLSKYIHKIEDELHVEVFDRKNRTILLTPAGEEFLVFAESALLEYRTIQNQLKRYIQDGCIRVGSIENISRLGLTDSIVSFMEDHPNINLNIQTGDTRTLMQNLGENRYDVAIIAQFIAIDGKTNIDSYPLDNYVFHTIIEDESYAVIGENHRLASMSEISWNELSDERIIILDSTYSSNSIIKNSFQYFNITPNIAYECNQVDTILGMVSSGYGISILSGKIAQSNYHVKMVKMNPSICRNTVIVVPKTNTSKSSRIFVDYLRKSSLCAFSGI